MGKGSNSQVVAPAEQEPIVTPTAARSFEKVGLTYFLKM